MPFRRLLHIALFVCLAPACNGAITNPQPGGEKGTPAPAPPPSPSLSADPPAPPPTSKGYVFIDSVMATKAPGVDAPTVAAVFYPKPLPESASRIYPRGACVYVPKVTNSNSPPDDTFPKTASAGRITVSAGDRVVKLKWLGTGYDVPTFPGSGPLAPDAPIHVIAEGATVPAFDVSIPVASPLSFTTPLDAGVSGTETLDLAWLPNTGTDAIIELYGEEGTVKCSGVDLAKGHVTVPEFLMRQLAASPLHADDGSSFIGLYQLMFTDTTVTVDDYAVYVQHSIDSYRKVSIH